MLKKIIWVDDDISLMDKADEMFVDYGFELVKCPTIATAWQEIWRGTSNYLLLDIDFPGNAKEGLIFLEQLRIDNPGLRVVLFTGYPELNDAVQVVKRLLASDYLAKPIPFEQNARQLFFEKLHKSFSDSGDFPEYSYQVAKFQQVIRDLATGDIGNFIVVLQSMFASLSYNMKVQESYFHGYIHIILDFAGIMILSEEETNLGRIDAVAETSKFIYLMEFKFDDPEIALEQIKKKKYFQKYMTSKKTIMFVGIAFDRAEKNIIAYKTENYSRHQD